jgi:hypothetical protein
MLIVNQGIHRECSETEYLNEYKALGYLVVTADEPKQEEKPKSKRGGVK